MIPVVIFPNPLTTVCTLTHDTAGWTLTSHPGTHFSGRPGQVFDVPDSTPDGNGCQLTIPGTRGETAYRAVLYLHLPTGAGLVVDDFPPVSVGGSVRPFRLDGHFPRYDDGTEMLINSSTGFRAFARYVAGEFAQLDAFCNSLQTHQINMLRVFLMGNTSLFYTDPAAWWQLIPPEQPNFYALLDEFVREYLPMFGLYPDLVCCTQTQTLLPDPARQVSHVRQVFEVMHDQAGLVSFVNEQGIYDNSVDGSVLLLQKPADATFLLSTGSLDSGNRSPFMPLHDVIEEHFNDANEWQRKSKDVMDDGNARDRAGYVSETTRTDKDTAAAGLERALAHYEDHANVATSMTMAALLHTMEGKNADPFDFSLPHVEAHNRGVNAGGLAYRRGRYHRDDVPPAGLIRQYYMTVNGLGTHPIPVRM